MILLFLSAFVVGLSGSMMPGPLLTYTVKKSLISGPKSGFIIVTGHALLELILIIVIFLGFSTVLQSQWIQIFIGIIGGIMLTYMGIEMIYDSAKNKVSIELDSDSTGSRSMLLSSIIICAVNPYFLLWWAVVGLGFIMQSYKSFGVTGVVIYYFGHIAADFFWYGLISVLVGTTRKFFKDKPYRIIIIVLGCILIFFGIEFVYKSIQSLLT